MTRSRDHLDISARAVALFGNDGRLDAGELQELISIAERDGVIDANEMRVLKSVIDRIQPHEIDAAMQERLQALARRISLPT